MGAARHCGGDLRPTSCSARALSAVCRHTPTCAHPLSDEPPVSDPRSSLRRSRNPLYRTAQLTCEGTYCEVTNSRSLWHGLTPRPVEPRWKHALRDYRKEEDGKMGGDGVRDGDRLGLVQEQLGGGGEMHPGPTSWDAGQSVYQLLQWRKWGKTVVILCWQLASSCNKCHVKLVRATTQQVTAETWSQAHWTNSILLFTSFTLSNWNWLMEVKASYSLTAAVTLETWSGPFYCSRITHQSFKQRGKTGTKS